MSLVNSRSPWTVFGVSLALPALTMVYLGLAPIFCINENEPATDNDQIDEQMTLMSIARITALTADATSATENYTSISVVYQQLIGQFGSISAISTPLGVVADRQFQNRAKPCVVVVVTKQTF